MFSGLFGKGKKSSHPPSIDKQASTPKTTTGTIKIEVSTPGLEVVEDDPETTWGLWDEAQAEQDSRFAASVLPPLSHSPLPDLPNIPEQPEAPRMHADFELPTQPMQLEPKTPEQRRDAALRIIEMHHPRIAKTLSNMWGYKECGEYITKLVMNGVDESGHARVGFNHRAVEAMLELADLHDALFVENPAEKNSGLPRSGSFTGWGKLG